MKRKLIIEIEGELRDGEVLVYKGGVLRSADVHELLPCLKGFKSDIRKLSEEVKTLKYDVRTVCGVLKGAQE